MNTRHFLMWRLLLVIGVVISMGACAQNRFEVAAENEAKAQAEWMTILREWKASGKLPPGWGVIEKNGLRRPTDQEGLAKDAERRALQTKWANTPFAHDNDMAARQCKGEWYLCEPEINQALQIRTAPKTTATGVTTPPRSWTTRFATISPDDRYVLMTLCQDATENCLLRRWVIATGTYEDLPQLAKRQSGGRLTYYYTAFDPTGRFIAASVYGCGPSTERCLPEDQGLQLLDANGALVRQIVGRTVTPELIAAARPGDFTGAAVYHPTFSPDGSKLAYWRGRGNALLGKDQRSDLNLYEYDLNTGKERKLDEIVWGTPLGGPRYIEGGKALAVSNDFNGELPARNPPPVLKDRGSYIFRVPLNTLLTNDNLQRIVEKEPNYGVEHFMDATADGRFLVMKGSTVMELGGFSAYLYDMEKQTTIKKLWEGGGYFPPEFYGRNTSPVMWGSRVAMVDLSGSQKYVVIGLGGRLEIRASRFVLGNLSDGTFKAIRGCFGDVGFVGCR